MNLEVAQLGQPILREVAAEVPVEEITTPEFQAFVADMIETMSENNGAGLAAPQVFVGKRVFVAGIHPPTEPDGPAGVQVFINPRIIGVSKETKAAWEGCLSFMELMALVPRHRAIRVEFRDAAGQLKQLDLHGFPARVVQHEYDHLDGILTIDRAPSTRYIVKTSEMDDILEDDDDDEGEEL